MKIIRSFRYLLVFFIWLSSLGLLHGQGNQISWFKKTNFGNEKTAGCVTFAIGENGYLYNGVNENVLLKYDAKTNEWKKLSPFPGIARSYAVAFTIGNMAYMGTGSYKINDSVSDLKDIWQYDPANDTWKQLGDFPGGIRHGAIAFSINGYGYIGLGGEPGTANSLSDLWKYDPKLDKWTKMADMPELGKINSSVFTADSEAYVLFGDAEIKLSVNKNGVYKYSPSTDSWAKDKDFPGHVNSRYAVFSMNNSGYIVSTPNNGGAGYSEIWEYAPQTKAWKQEKAKIVPAIQSKPFCFVIDTLAFISISKGKDNGATSADSSFGCISMAPTAEFNAKLLYKKNDRKVPLSSQKLSLISQKKVLQTTVTDSTGAFNFTKVDAQGKYEVVLEKNPTLPDNAVVSLAKPNGKIVQDLKKNGDDQFYYEVSKLDFISEDDSYFNLQNFMKSSDSTLTVTTHINYATNSWELNNESEELLYEIIVSLKQYPNLRVEVSSHTDAVGSEEDNMQLSEKRAKTVVQYIISNGVSSLRISGTGYGSTKLLNRCKHGVICSEEENMVNRRTEFKFLKL